jgi:hypothetical protein
MALPQSYDVDSTTDDWNKNSAHEPLIDLADGDEMPAINASNPSYHPIPSTTTSQTNHPVVDSLANQAKTELKKGQQQAEDIITKTKRVLKQHCKSNVLEYSNASTCP